MILSLILYLIGFFSVLTACLFGVCLGGKGTLVDWLGAILIAVLWPLSVPYFIYRFLNS